MNDIALLFILPDCGGLVKGLNSISKFNLVPKLCLGTREKTGARDPGTVTLKTTALFFPSFESRVSSLGLSEGVAQDGEGRGRLT
jgi:hypothetical protein